LKAVSEKLKSRKKFKLMMMKNKGFKMAVLLLMFSIVFAACKKDAADKRSQIVYNGTEYNLAKGYLEYDGTGNTDPNSYWYYIILVSSEVTIDYTLGLNSGLGHGIVLEIYSSSQNDIIPGTYTYDALETYNANTFDWGAMFLDYDFGTINKAATALQVTDGTIEIAKSGSEYEITCNCMVTGGKAITGYFKGSLEYHDVSKKKQPQNKMFFK
jgi:hypothetical protein